MGMREDMPASDFDPAQVIEEFEAMTMDAERVQKETLKRILEQNRETEYLQKWGLGGKTDPESFKACVPLVTYDDLEPYIQRIVDGDHSPILTGKPLTAMSLSSGTSGGKPKLVPFNDATMASVMQIVKTSYSFRNREFSTEKGKCLHFFYGTKHDEHKTKGGLPARPISINVNRHPLYEKKIQMPCCSPDEVVFGADFHQSVYCHLLCGLLSREDVQVISSSFAHNIVDAFRTLEQVLEELCTDIRNGVLSSRISIPTMRKAMSRFLRQPNPELADLIHSKCRGLSDFNGLIPELFPNTRYIYGIMTGSMEPYLKKLRHYAGDVPLICADYAASEGMVGANVNPKLPPEMVTFALLPNIGYFEFLPLNQGSSFSEPVGLTGVKVGQQYEVVLTTFAGMYRYNLGDVVKVKGFHNRTPEVQFIRRKNLLLTINTEKTTERELQLSVEAAAEVLAEAKLEVVDFTSEVDSTSDPAHYVIFWEISGEATSDEILQDCCNCLDQSFKDPAYQIGREAKTIGALELRILKTGAFHKIMDHSVGLGASASQFKTPRCVGAANTSVLHILHENVAEIYFSTAF